MPIEIKAIPLADYLNWVKYAQANYALNSFAPSLISSPLPVNKLADASSN